MNKIFLTSDLHIGHEKIIYHCRRPFATKEEHDATIIKNFNDTVGHADHVYILGDITFDKYESLVEQLNGFKHIILGNHDNKKRFQAMLDKPACKVVRVCDVHMLKHNGNHIWLSHYPHRTWKNSFHGAYHAFGHVHGTLGTHGRSMDVGLDNNNMKPILLEDFIERLKDEPFGRHLGEFKGLRE